MRRNARKHQQKQQQRPANKHSLKRSHPENTYRIKRKQNNLQTHVHAMNRGISCVICFQRNVHRDAFYSMSALHQKTSASAHISNMERQLDRNHPIAPARNQSHIAAKQTTCSNTQKGRTTPPKGLRPAFQSISKELERFTYSANYFSLAAASSTTFVGAAFLAGAAFSSFLATGSVQSSMITMEALSPLR